MMVNAQFSSYPTCHTLPILTRRRSHARDREAEERWFTFALSRKSGLKWDLTIKNLKLTIKNGDLNIKQMSLTIKCLRHRTSTNHQYEGFNQ
jgi:hypothetical protein